MEEKFDVNLSIFYEISLIIVFYLVHWSRQSKKTEHCQISGS